MITVPRLPATRRAELNMAPLIDMTFLLLIFFILNTSFVKETGLEVNRPKAISGRVVSGDMVLVGVSAAGTIHMSGRRVDLAAVRDLVARARSRRPDSPVVVVADQEAKVGLVVRVVDQCRLAGAKDVAVATRQEHR